MRLVLLMPLLLGVAGLAHDSRSGEGRAVDVVTHVSPAQASQSPAFLADSLKSQLKSGVVVIASASDGKVQFVVAVTSDLTPRIKAGAIVKAIAPIVGGGGGGRADFAEAGGKNPDRIDEMIAAVPGAVETLLKS